MRVRQILLVAALIAGSAALASAQADPRPEPRAEWRYERPHFHFRFAPDRMRTLERALDRAERVRERVRTHSLERLNSFRDRELAVRDRLNDRMSADLWRGIEARERAMERVRDRLDRVRDQHRLLLRRRWRTI
jgi:hypothetical protein